MKTFYSISNLEQCREIWQAAMGVDTLTDLWEVRACFQKHFNNRPHFIVAEDEQGICGLLPLSWLEQQNCYHFFPGETWQEKTWLEQNKIVCKRGVSWQDLLSRCPGGYHLRYLSEWPEESSQGCHIHIDELGYLFLPPRYNYSSLNFFSEFSRKSMKTILKELSRLESLGAEYRYDDFADFGLMVELNIERFGAQSYFFDPRFRDSFFDLALYLKSKGWLRITTLLIEGEAAAIDMGAVYRDTYTLLAGGTCFRYPGAGKMINLHHIQRACRERWDKVDFLCGDFKWKPLFHLTPRPLYLLANTTIKAA